MGVVWHRHRCKGIRTIHPGSGESLGVLCSQVLFAASAYMVISPSLSLTFSSMFAQDVGPTCRRSRSNYPVSLDCQRCIVSLRNHRRGSGIWERAYCHAHPVILRPGRVLL
jgi:hypothetical protein